MPAARAPVSASVKSGEREGARTVQVEHGEDGDYVNYARGADRASFERVAEAMLAYGAV